MGRTAIASADADSLAALVESAQRRAVAGRIVLLFADSRYLEVLLNWLVAAARLPLDGYLVVALDRPLHDFLNRQQIPCVLVEVPGELRALWIRRMEVFAALNLAGLHILHSDADAIWLRDPRQDFFDGETDLTISQGTVWPPDVHRQLGFVMCCGLFQLRSSPRTARLMHDLQQDVRVTGDDQVSLNRQILARRPVWQVDPAMRYVLEGAGQRFLCSRTSIAGTGADGLTVRVLPHHLFQRVPDATAQAPYVLHLLSPKDAAAKLHSFDLARCRFLRPDWRSIEFDGENLLRLAMPA